MPSLSIPFYPVSCFPSHLRLPQRSPPCLSLYHPVSSPTRSDSPFVSCSQVPKLFFFFFKSCHCERGSFFFSFKFYLFIYLWLCWVFVSVRGLSLVAASGGHSSSRCAGLSLSRTLVAEHRLQTRRLSSCGSQTQLLRGMWDLPRPGLEPVSPALAGRFSTTAPPGKPPKLFFTLFQLYLNIYWGGIKMAEQKVVEFACPHKYIKNTSTNGTILINIYFVIF